MRCERSTPKATSEQRVQALKQETECRATAPKEQLTPRATPRPRSRAGSRGMHFAYHARGAKLSQAWCLTKEALAV